MERAFGGETALRVAARNGHYSTAQLLLDRRANPNVANRSGETPLHLAAKKGHTAQLLQADPNVATSMGKKARHPAVQNSNYSTLLGRGADPGVATSMGKTAHPAAQIGHDSTVHLPLDRAADFNVASRNGETALLPAAHSGHDSSVRLLLDGEANRNIANRSGGTTLHPAARNGHDFAVQKLSSAGEVISQPKTTNDETATPSRRVQTRSSSPDTPQPSFCCYISSFFFFLREALVLCM